MGRHVISKRRDRYPVPEAKGLRILQAMGIGVWLLLLHGASHAVFQPESPNSCIDCHSSLPDQRLSEPVGLWAESVHAEVGNTCDGCHGGDPQDPTLKAMSPENHFYAAPEHDEVITFCGKCHQELSQNFMASAHAQTNSQTCIDCHGTHTIHRISLEIIRPEKCGECHEYEPAEKLKNILQGLHDNFHKEEDRLKEIRRFPTTPLEKDLDKTWKELRQVRMISHTFDIERVEKEAEMVQASLVQTGNEINRLLEMDRERNFWGFLIICLFAALSVLIYFYNKDNQDSETDQD